MVRVRDVILKSESAADHALEWKKVGSTEDHYKDPETGQWDPERAAMPEGRRPVAYVLGEGTASGKTW